MSGLGRRAFLAAGATLLAGCSTGVDAPAADGTTGTTTRPPTATAEPDRETPRGEVTRAATGGVETRWETFVPGQYTLSAPALGREALYIGGDHELRRLAQDDGAVEWEAPLGALTHGFVPALGDGVVYAAARDLIGGTLLNSDDGGWVAALAADDGTERWRTGALVTADPVLADAAVLVPTTGADAASLRALAADDGTERWRAALGPGDAFAAPAVAGDRAVVSTARDGAGRIVGVGLADGDEAWSVETDPVQAPAAVAGGTAYVGTTAGTLLALDAASGAERWRQSFDGGVYTRPALAGDTLYVAVSDAVHALSVDDGAERWRAPVSNVSRTGLTVADGRVYVGGTEVVVLDAASGDGAWRQRLVGVSGTFGAPAVRDGVLYTGACVKREGNDPYDHYVYALVEAGG